jgi:site-specific recombinase XerD
MADDLMLIQDDRALAISGPLAELLPPMVGRAGPKAAQRWLQFFTAELTNDNTRMAYAQATGEFFDWVGELDPFALATDDDLKHIRSIHIATWREMLVKTPAQRKGRAGTGSAPGVVVEKTRSAATIKLKIAAVRSLFSYLKEGGVLDDDPAASVRAPKMSVTGGKTPYVTGNEAAKVLDSITGTKPVDLRDRALIALMTYTLARVSAAVGMTVRDVFVQGNRRYVRLHEKGGKELVMPCHHELEDYLTAYIAAAGLTGQPDTPLFRAMDNTTRKLGANGLTRMKAWEMVQRRTANAGIDTHACNHTFRATGITTFLENGGELSKARDMAGHASIRTTQLYDRRSRAVKIDDVVLINLRAKAKD